MKKKPLLEVQNEQGDWVKVGPFIFRSYLGPRRVNGTDHKGPVYHLGSDQPIKDSDEQPGIKLFLGKKRKTPVSQTAGVVEAVPAPTNPPQGG